MLDSVTKRRIDSCRDMLVGKVPDPKSQVEQITFALIYKFMDDMDAESEQEGGLRSFFAGVYAKYGWANLMSPRLGGQEVLNLYSEALVTMPQNDGIPTLFRDIFKNAYLPFRDPETLRSFLKEINNFTYDHSERLGDAFEYLLLVLGSQGDAGQFRTPRHIIDFIVTVIDPKIDETILDPACGTAGFLISAYKHIQAAHAPAPLNADQRGQLKHILDAYTSPPLTADQRNTLAKNLKGYDISPDMVRLSLVNLYLHGFRQPQIEEYDALTSDDKWNEHADVILANPPFMSPKGGIKPHKRFTVSSNRSEVLFVDYIAEHLTKTGRAGVIVPEGIIFQSGTSYKSLRKMLVNEYLVAVVSLPAGVFQPYSGVKTSVLVMDRRLAKSSDSVLFVKIASDGFGLGAQRRAVAANDMPDAARLLTAWMASLRDGTPFDPAGAANVQVVPKSKIAASGDYNLGGDRYRITIAVANGFPFVAVGDLSVEMRPGFASGNATLDGDGVPHLRPMNINERGQFTWGGTKYIAASEFIGKEEYALRAGDVLFNNTNSKELVGKTCLIEASVAGAYSNHMTRIRVDENLCNPRYLAAVLHDAWRRGLFLDLCNKWIGQAGINTKALQEFAIPLPPLAVQQEIVAEIEGYQKRIEELRLEVAQQERNIKTAIGRVWGDGKEERPPVPPQ